MAAELRNGRKQPGLTVVKQQVSPVRRIAVHDLLAGGREAVLLHEEQEYRLRLTSNGKLILTK